MKLFSMTCRPAAAMAALCVLALAQADSVAQSSAEARRPYESGVLSNAEQYYLELVNRARMYPAIEGGILSRIADSSARLEYDYFGVDLDAMEREIAMYPPLPPLAPNKRLSEMAYDHAMDMLLNEFQGHEGSTGDHLQKRAEDAGYYDWTALGENVFSYAQTPDHSHASFEVDWGRGDFGMQENRPHRENIHNPDFREIGIARILGRNGSVGPELVAQEFGDRESAGAFVTGVVYYDLNGSRFYEPGEGLGGVVVTLSGSPLHAVTGPSGGYALPAPGDGSYEVTFSIEGLEPHTERVEIVNSENVKVDYLPEWAPPTIKGPRLLARGVATPYRINHAPGTVATDVLVCRVEENPAGENAERESDGIRFEVSGDYEPVQSERVAEGAAAFHLAHETADATSQILSLERTFIPGPASAVHFRSLLAHADSGQLAKLQIRANGGEFWQDLWVKEGSSGDVETEFTDQHIELSGFAGQWIQLRFNFFIGAGYMLEGSSLQHGWFIDDIALTGVEEVSDIRVHELGKEDVFDLVLPRIEKVRIFTRGRTQGASLPPSSPVNVRSLANNFEGWKTRTRAELRQSTGRPLFERYALEPNKGVTPEAKVSGDKSEISLTYTTDTARSDVRLEPQVKIDDSDWTSVNTPALEEQFTDQLIQAKNGSHEKRRAVFRIGSSRNVQLRLAIIAEEEEDNEDESEDAITQN